MKRSVAFKLTSDSGIEIEIVFDMDWVQLYLIHWVEVGAFQVQTQNSVTQWGLFKLKTWPLATLVFRKKR